MVTAIVTTPTHPLIALAMTLWEVHYALSISLSSRVRAVIKAPKLTAICTDIGFIAIASSIITNSSLATMITMLGIEVVYVNEYQRVRTILQVATQTMQAIFASTAT